MFTPQKPKKNMFGIKKLLIIEMHFLLKNLPKLAGVRQQFVHNVDQAVNDH